MNITIKKLSEKAEENLDMIKINHQGIKTNTKAIEFALEQISENEFLISELRIKELEYQNKIKNLEREIEKFELVKELLK